MLSLRRGSRWRRLRVALRIAAVFYAGLVLFAITNGKARCVVDMPTMFSDPVFLTGGKCRVDIDNLGLSKIDIFDHPNITDLETANQEVMAGGAWSPNNCQPWQRVAIIVPYRDRLNHLLLLLKRLHPLMRRQKVRYQVFVVEQAGEEKFNRGRLLNIGVKESLKVDNFDCFVFHDVDLLPEHDRNIYYCDNNARHLASAIDEMRYHVMYYNYAGGVISINKNNVFKMNGYSNDYWGWGNEDDDFSARTMEMGLKISRPPEHIGRYKMVRHTKQWRAENGYDLFISWRSRWKTDGLNSLDNNKYKVLNTIASRLYTTFVVDIGRPPEKPPIDPTAPKESLTWFLSFFFP